jgi:hypothetical protein
MPLSSLFEGIKPQSEEDKMMEESMGDPRFEKYYNPDKGKDYVTPKGEHPFDKIPKKEEVWEANPLAGVTDDQINKLFEGLKKEEKGPVSDWEVEVLRKNVKKTRDSQDVV